jgi:hypothetical protein
VQKLVLHLSLSFDVVLGSSLSLKLKTVVEAMSGETNCPKLVVSVRAGSFWMHMQLARMVLKL